MGRRRRRGEEDEYDDDYSLITGTDPMLMPPAISRDIDDEVLLM
jgi:hypothetical protein